MTTTSLPILPRRSFGIRFGAKGFAERFGDKALGIAMELVNRFVENDWGTICEEDRQANIRDLLSFEPCRLMGSYEVEGETVWVISYVHHDPAVQLNPDYCNTCVMLPSDY